MQHSSTLHHVRRESRVRCGRRVVLLPLLRQATGQQRSVLRFSHNDLQLRPGSTENLPNALESTSCPVSCDPEVELLSGKIGEDLRAGCVGVGVGVGVVLELSAQQPTVCLERRTKKTDS